MQPTQRILFVSVSHANSECTLKCVIFNARSVCNKLPELHHLLYSANTSYDIIMLTESWLNVNVPDSILDPYNQYVVFRCDRQLSHGGGVCAFVSKRFNAVAIDLAESYSELEICCFDLLYSGARCRLLVVYRAPSSDHMPRLLECINAFSNVKYHCIIAGDFNCNGIDWQTLKAPCDGTQDALLNFAIMMGFSQVVQSPTRGDNLLDLVFSNEPLAMCNVNVIHPFGNSDHCQIEFSVFTDSSFKRDVDLNVVRYDWNKADFDSISGYIAAVNWLDILTVNLTADSLWSAFSTVLQMAIDMYVPKKRVSEFMNVKYRRWYPAALRHAISKKRCLWSKKRDDPNNATLAAAYHTAEQKCKQLLRDYEIKKEQKVIERNNAGSFYRFVNNKLSCKRGLGALSDSSGDVIVSDAERADMLNSYFSSVCTTDDGIMPVIKRSVPENVELDFIDFTPSKVCAAIGKLKAGGSCGPDGYPPLLFKRIKDCIAWPLSLMFTSLMSVGKTPKE